MIDVVIGDEHCRGKFISIYEKIKNRNDIRYIISTGDYFDPYDAYSLEDKLNNFDSIIKAARIDKRIKPLLGNHDIHYLIDTDTSRMDTVNERIIRNAFLFNLDLFSLAIELDNDTIVSHAGISPDWMKTYGYESVEDINSILNSLVDNTEYGDNYYHSEEAVRKRKSITYQHCDKSGWGDNVKQTLTWIRPLSLLETDWKWKTQIVGHTRTDVRHMKSYFNNSWVVLNYEELQFYGGIEVIKSNDNKKLIMVDTGDCMLTYLIR